MPDDGLIAAYRGRLSEEVQDAILIAGIPPGVVANLYIETGIMLALTWSLSQLKWGTTKGLHLRRPTFSSALHGWPKKRLEN